MKYTIQIPPYRPEEVMVVTTTNSKMKPYSLLTIGKESYIIKGMIENSDEGYPLIGKIIHNLQIGKYCSIAEDVYFLIGRDKNYKRVSTSAAKVLHKAEERYELHRDKGSIIIENDVWIGRKVSVMSGVTIHNGAIVAACSHVVKDVPPYAIVGGNPARIIGYRFEADIIQKLQTIQWWNWPDEKIEENAEFFNDDIEEFCQRFYDHEKRKIEQVKNEVVSKVKDIYFMLLDHKDYYSVLENVLCEFVSKWGDEANKQLLLYMLDSEYDAEYLTCLRDIIESIYSETELGCDISIQSGSWEKVKKTLPTVSHIIINRNANTIPLLNYAEQYGNRLSIISGVDSIIFK